MVLTEPELLSSMSKMRKVPLALLTVTSTLGPVIVTLSVTFNSALVRPIVWGVLKLESKTIESAPALALADVIRQRYLPNLGCHGYAVTP
jgi:hypothetical protein